MKQLAKQKSPEDLMEYEPLPDRWKQVVHAIADAKAKAAAARKSEADVEVQAEADVGVPAANELEELHKPAQAFKQNSEEYWKALANQRLRTYVQMVAEPKTQQQLQNIIQTSNMQGLNGVEGKTAVLILLDSELLAEHNRADRRPPLPEERLQKLLTGALGGRGAPPTGLHGEITLPISQDVLVLVDHRCNTAKPLNAALMSVPGKHPAVKTSTVVYDDASLRARRQRVSKTAYTRKAAISFYSAKTLFPDTIPEKKFLEPYNGHNTGDIIGFVRAAQPSELWQVSRKDSG